MTAFVITYDLRKPGQNYKPLWDRLAAWKAVRALESAWFIQANTTAVALRDDLRRYIDENDRLFVGALGPAAWHNVVGQAGQHLKSWAA